MSTCPKCKHQFKAENQAAGGRARWRNVAKPERAKIMAKMARARWTKAKL